MDKLTIVDLFSGIGGFSLGLEATGHFKTIAFCEREPYCQAVLARHWPEVPCHDDIRTIPATDYTGANIVTAGFPCQDISLAGKGAGLAGERSGLFWDTLTAIRDIRPEVVLLENVAALLVRGLDAVVYELATLGYDVEWHCIPAGFLGAPHWRDRVWIIAHTLGDGLQGKRESGEGESACQPIITRGTIARAYSTHGLYGCWQPPESDLCRVANGIPDRAHRLKALGNAIVPPIAQTIGEAVLDRYAA